MRYCENVNLEKFVVRMVAREYRESEREEERKRVFVCVYKVCSSVWMLGCGCAIVRVCDRRSVQVCVRVCKNVF